jgi:hypothetical protein
MQDPNTVNNQHLSTQQSFKPGNTTSQGDSEPMKYENMFLKYKARKEIIAKSR